MTPEQRRRARRVRFAFWIITTAASCALYVAAGEWVGAISVPIIIGFAVLAVAGAANALGAGRDRP